MLFWGIAAFGAPLAGFLIAYLLERLDHGFRTAGRVESVLGYPVLTTLPDIGSSRRAGSQSSKRHSKRRNVADLVVDRPLSAYSEAVRGLQLGITLSNVDSTPRVVLVTSALPGEGKTTTALSLARHVAQTGLKVVLVDSDLRRPNVGVLSGKTDVPCDFVDVLKGDVALERAFVQDTKSSAMLLLSKGHVRNAPDLIESQAMAKLVGKLRTYFDLVILDSAPILPVTDTRTLTRLADAVLFVVRWEKTPRDAAADALKSLREIRAPIVGVALTMADTKRLHYYSFGYSNYYYTYSKYYET
jgi:capsular exopolysaccharide synthesis family protein